MTQLCDLFDLADLDRMLAEGLVARREHPTLPLVLFNYTDRCQYEPGRWNRVTSQCRGLIATEDGAVVARPFQKFFNYGQPGAPLMALDERVQVTDKLDGSLGILYPTGDGFFAIATRGSFESEQALHATDLWDSRYANTPVPTGWTLLFEIVYPANRIVVDYGPLDDLVLLGAVDIVTGSSIGPTFELLAGWSGPRANVFDYRTLADALAAAPRPNAEGIVVRFEDDTRIKIKQDDYVALHKIVTGLNERAVWEHLSGGESVVTLLEKLPDEFHEWTLEVAGRLQGAVISHENSAFADFKSILTALPEGFSRRDFADRARGTAMPWAMFSLLDGKDCSAQFWKLVYPAGNLQVRSGVTP